ncbi:hypothetical protein N9834_01380 [Akkermansiaceae bacterium]|nr:hypothetical protein [Akkermansiaceae bacterium]MDA7901090.1 hypothetical protein [bacterium]MDB0068790.1 hypothetical protein [Akkermansiaceae bacterium]MDB4106764.1 hypothetical protein [bacterium]MDB4142706.1 hypothetical protein [Akkermansiaceae bacterium]
MPHLVKMDKKMKPKGLSIIAAESQNTPEDTIKGILDEHKAEFTVTRQVRGPLSSRGIPNAYVFDVEGQLIFKGHPMSPDFEKVIKKALKDYEAEPAEPERKGDLFPQRTWKNSEGKPLVAAITEINGDKVTFKLKNGRKIPYDISKLSEEDQKLIKEKSEE